MSRRMLQVQIRQVNAQTFVHKYIASAHIISFIGWHFIRTNVIDATIYVSIAYRYIIL